MLQALAGVFSYTTIVRTKVAEGNDFGLDFSEFRPYNSVMKTPRMGRPPKGDEPLSERLELRITASDAGHTSKPLRVPAWSVRTGFALF